MFTDSRYELTRRALIEAAMLIVAVGCGPKDPFGRQPIKGTVSLEGEPVQYGVLTLEPAESQPAGSTAPIRDGKFAIPRQQGPCAGKYHVWVQVLDRSGDVPPGTLPGQEGPPPRNILPDKYRKGPIAELVVEKIESDAVATDHVIDIR